jgi:hypothetical protein
VGKGWILTVGDDGNVQLGASLGHAVLERLGAPQRELDLDGLDLGHLGGTADGGGADLGEGDAADAAGVDVLLQCGQGGLDVGVVVLARGLELVDAALGADQALAVLDAGLDGRGGAVDAEVLKGAALDVEQDLVLVLGVLLVVRVEECQRVVVGRAVELAAVQVVAAAVEGSLDHGEGLLVGELAGAPCQACWVSWLALRWLGGDSRAYPSGRSRCCRFVCLGSCGPWY